MQPYSVTLRKSVVARQARLVARLYEDKNPEQTAVGLLGEHAVLAMFQQMGWLNNHQSFTEMQKVRFGQSNCESAIDILARPRSGVEWRAYQVKSSVYGACWISDSCLKTCEQYIVEAVYFVDVDIQGPVAHCTVYHRATPAEIRRDWVKIHGNVYTHPEYHRQDRIGARCNELNLLEKPNGSATF